MQESTPFVVRSGGHSEWSTIGSQGFVIDLSLYSGVAVHKEARAVTLKGSILAKPLAVALAEAGMFTGKSKTTFLLRHDLTVRVVGWYRHTVANSFGPL